MNETTFYFLFLFNQPKLTKMDYSQMSEEELTQVLNQKNRRLDELINQMEEIQIEVLAISQEIVEISKLENSPSTGL